MFFNSIYMHTKLNNILYGLLFSGLGVFSYLLLMNYIGFSEKSGILHTLQAILFFIVSLNIIGYSTLKLSAWINKQYSLYLKKRWKIALMYATVIVILLLLNYGLVVIAKLLCGAFHPFIFPNGGFRILILVWLVELVVLGLLLANKFMQNTLKLQHKAAELQSENNIARYTALQNQLNPHFLFNSLNTLIAEIEYAPENAVVFTKNLSNVYRYVLQCQDKPLVSIGDELEFVRAYLFLHEVRLGNCIKWQENIPANYVESLLPPLTLQLLIENVIKHNVITINKPIHIHVSVDGNNLIVSNTPNPKKENLLSGIGLKNLSNRCKLILNRDIDISQTEDLFTVKVPILYE